jgi:phage tail-like protein
MTDQNALLGWLREASGETFAANGNTLTRKTFAIALKDRTGQTLRTYNFVDAFPVSWSGPSFSLGGEEMPSEELEVTHHGFTVETPSDPNAAGPGPASSSGSSGGAGAPQGAAGSPGGR